MLAGEPVPMVTAWASAGATSVAVPPVSAAEAELERPLVSARPARASAETSSAGQSWQCRPNRPCSHAAAR